MGKKIEISHKTVFFVTLFLLSLWLLYEIKDILLIIFIAFIFMSAFQPSVERLEKRHIPTGIAILIIYLIFWTVIIGIIAGIVPGVIDQSMRLVNILPAAFQKLDIVSVNQDVINEQLISRVGSLPENILRLTVGIFGNILNVLTTIVISFYLLLEHRRFPHYLRNVFDTEHADRVNKLLDKIEHRLGGWIRGELILMLSVGTLTYIGLLVLGVDSALPLAVLAGFLEIIPNIGPTISAIPAVIVAFSVHPFLAVSTTALYFLVQFLENHLLVPKIMQKAVGVNPLISIVALMIGFKLSGPAGAVLALPTIIIIESIFSEYHPSSLFHRLLA